MFSIDGLVSGFDTTSIIDSLLQFQQNQIDLLNSRKLEIATKQTSFGGIEAQLVSLRASMGRLNRTTGSVFESKTTTSTDESILTASSGTKANNGVYSLTVNSLAKAHQIASQGFEDVNSEITTGDFSIRVGDKTTANITIDQTNNTVEGFVNAINAATDDVSASIVQDQASDTYRILLTSVHTGASNEISIVDNLASGNKPDFSGDPVQAATNASITLGSGVGAITSEYETNQVNDLIEDVTLNLVNADSTKTVSVNIGSDTEPAKEAVQEFVDDFNKIMEFIDAQTAFDPETNTASPLLGNRNVTSIQNELRNFVIETVPGLQNGFNRLANIGIDITAQGNLTLDQAQLDKALNGEIDGVDSDSIKRLFGLQGESNNSGIEFILGSSRTASLDSPVEIDIIQAAEQATITGGTIGETVKIVDGQNEIQFSLNGQDSGVLTLNTGTYTQQELADHIESVINSSDELAGSVSVSIDNDALVVTTEEYGSSAKIENFSGSAISLLGFDGSELDTGQDVAGTFVVDGVTETATGSGRVLTGDSDNEFTADLQIRVSLTSSQVASGVDAELQVTRGVSARIDQYLSDVLDPTNGKLNTINEDFDSRISSIDDSIERVVELTEQQRQYLVAQFAVLESTIADLQQTGNVLSSQLANLAG